MSGETIGELYDRLPIDEWVELPEYGVRIKKPVTTAEGGGEADQSKGSYGLTGKDSES